MRMEAAMRTPRARNAYFDHARRYAVIAGQLFRVVQLWLRSYSRSATAYNFCIQGQIRLTRHLVISSQVGSPFRSAAERLQFGQSPVWSLPLAVEAEATGRGHDDEAIMLRSATFASTRCNPLHLLHFREQLFRL